MAQIVGGPLTPGVITQLSIRQKKYSKLDRRTDKDLQYLTSKTGWAKMTSGVNIQGSNATAAEYILIGGQIGRFGEQAYSNFDETTGRGFRPMPGINDVQVRSLGRFGTLKEATVTFNCWDVAQLTNLELLYMRPGYTVLLEWGHSVYFTEEQTLDTVPSTVGEMIKGGVSKEFIYDKIEQLKVSSRYNYDGIFGFIKNFSWSFRPDGGYDCTTTIISIGEIVESLIIDTDVSANTVDNTPAPTTNPPSPQEVQFSTMIENVLKVSKDSPSIFSSTVQTNFPDYFEKYKNLTGKTKIGNIVYLPGVTTKDSATSTTPAPASNFTFIYLVCLCEIINAALLVDNNERNLIRLHTTPGRAKFRTFTEHVSSDPGICIILTSSVSSWYSQISSATTAVEVAKGVLDNTSYDEILNIFVNVDLIMNVLIGIRNQPKESRTVINLMRPVLDKLTEALGNINDFDLHYEEEEFTYHIVDRMVKPDKSTIPTLQITGLQSTVTQFNLTTKLPPSVTNAVTIAAQAGAADVGLEVEAFLAWNNGLKDRIISQKKQKITDTDQETLSTQRTKAQQERAGKIMSAFNSFWISRTYIKDQMDSARTNFTQYATTYVQFNEPGTPAGIVPFETQIQMEGISGIKKGQVFKINSGIMPSDYDGVVGFFITGIDHDIKDNRWVTSIKAQTVIIGERKKSTAPVVEKKGLQTPTNPPRRGNNDAGSVQDNNNNRGSDTHLPSQAYHTSLPSGNRGGRAHHGYDLVGKYQGNTSLIVCNKPGTITHAGWINGYGTSVEIQHTDGTLSFYGHLDTIQSGVKVGATIGVGNIIGVEGNTGGSTGRHLHFEERVLRPAGKTNRGGIGSPIYEINGYGAGVKPWTHLDSFFYYQKKVT